MFCFYKVNNYRSDFERNPCFATVLRACNYRPDPCFSIVFRVNNFRSDFDAKPEELDDGDDAEAEAESQKTSDRRKEIDPSQPRLPDVLKDGRRIEEDLNRRDVVLVSVVRRRHPALLEDDVRRVVSEVRFDALDEVGVRAFLVFVQNLLTPDSRFGQF